MWEIGNKQTESWKPKCVFWGENNETKTHKIVNGGSQKK